MNSLLIYEASWEMDWQFSPLGPTMALAISILGTRTSGRFSGQPQTPKTPTIGNQYCLSEHSKEKHGISGDQTASSQM